MLFRVANVLRWTRKRRPQQSVSQQFENADEAMQAAFRSLAGTCFGKEPEWVRHRLMERFLLYSSCHRSKWDLCRAFKTTDALAQSLALPV